MRASDFAAAWSTRFHVVHEPLEFMSGGGACGELARSVDWNQTALGPPRLWPAALKTAVGILLHSRQPMFLWWGDELVQIYNDAYVPSFGVGKHPAAMGQRGADCWQEIWPIIKPQIDDVMMRGKASWNVDHLVPIWRNGRIEEVYWTYGYSPVYADDGAIGGTLVVCTETTRSVVAQRRLAALRSLALALLGASSAAEISRHLLGTLERSERDVPFAATWAPGEPVVCTGSPPALAAALERLRERLAPGRHALDEPLAVGPWPEPVTEVLVVPIDSAVDRVLVFGVSSRLPLDDEYESFLGQIVEHAVSALARLRTEGERRNLLEQAPVAAALLTGPEHVFEIANPPYRAMVGRDVLGKTFLAAFPELRGERLPDDLDRVYRLGERFVASEMSIRLRDAAGDLVERCFNFSIEPVRSAVGAVMGMMVVAIDITAQVNARRTLEQTNQERARLLADARAASRAKDEFLAMLGHELRNPLAPIITALDLMQLHEPLLFTRERAIIRDQARHLVSLVDDLLDVARVAQGKVELKRVRISCSEVIARAIETVSPLLEEKAHVLSVDVHGPDLDVDADPIRLRQIVANLLTNAAKYTPPGGRVWLSGDRDGDEIVLRVGDNGIGIAAEQLPHLFDMFFQGPQRSDRAEGGLGLGLSLVKTFATLHGGSVRAQSDGLGRGSVFEVRVPAARPGVTPAPPRAAAPAELPGSVRHVLVVDDNVDLAEMLSAFLQSLGFDVRTAADAFTALELATTFRPDVAFLDIGLPVVDGYDLAVQLRARVQNPRLKLIAMTGYGRPENRERSRQAGFDMHLVKPVDAAALLHAMNAVSAPADGPAQ